MLEGSVAMRPTRRAAGTFGLGLGLGIALGSVLGVGLGVGLGFRFGFECSVATATSIGSGIRPVMGTRTSKSHEDTECMCRIGSSAPTTW